VRGKLHGYVMQLDLSNWSDRQAWLLGRFYDLPTQLFLTHLLRPGDHFADIGANVGMITLLAARLVQPGGRVDSFEPNPVAMSRLREVCAHNRLETVVHTHALGMSDQPGELELCVPTAHTGTGTFARIPAEQESAGASRHKCRIETGDRILLDLVQGPLTIKIDVEGFESYVLRGLHETIRRHRPAIVLETVPGHLRRAGSSVHELVELLHSHGYEGFALSTRRSGRRHRLVMERLAQPSDVHSNNAAWVIPQSELATRLDGQGLRTGDA
jgi:FkbM family methyltransferase